VTDLHVDVLVVDEWAPGREILRSALRRAGHAAEAAADGAEAVGILKSRRPQLLLLDHAICSRDDWELLRRLRAVSELAIFVVIGPDDEADRIQALNRGADEYFAKPVNGAALAATVAANLRMVRRIAEPRQDEVYDDGLVSLHIGMRRVSVAGRDVPLTPLEFRLLAALVRHRDRVLTREDLQDMAWHGTVDHGSDHVKLYVHYIRRKLGEATNVELIRTVRGFGYQWLGVEAVEVAQPIPFRRRALSA
jgi:DNA-binding response OmpR family regulator